jgi:hypothetical protein
VPELSDAPDGPIPESGVSSEEIIQKIEADNEKEYLKELKEKNKGFLVDDLSSLEKSRIAMWICDRINSAMPKHKELEDRIDDYDETFRMERKEVPGSDGDMPNYRTPLSTVALEVMHANVMNVFFTPKDIGRVLPTEENDAGKVQKLATFMNWSASNELRLYENIDRLFHSSGKNGECPYIVHWCKEYGTENVREIIRNPANPNEPLFDPDTQEPLFQEREEQKLLYNAPKLEVFSRKDYIRPDNTMMDKPPDWEARRLRISFDAYLRDVMQGKKYKGSIDDIKDWHGDDSDESEKEDFEGNRIPTGKYEKVFYEWYGRMRIKLVKLDEENDTVETEELEDEFIAIVNLEDEVLCGLRRNKFPLKMRPIGMDYFIPDDDGRQIGIGIMEFMDSLQKAYDALYNQYILGVTNANNPFGFFSPFGNKRDEPIKIKNGYLFPSSDPSSVNLVRLPPPDESITSMIELINQWSQLLFGISDYASGVESKIDPSAPAKKAEIVVAQGNVRMNNILKRKLRTLKDIFKRWYLLYKENMPPNKYMRIVGNSEQNPWKFEAIRLEDFALKSIPDFELTGNILNMNKSFQANKAIAIYQIMIANPFFQPATAQGIQSLHQLTKWLIDQLEETGLSRFLPEAPGENVITPEEENARFMQGDEGEPLLEEDHVQHIKVHRQLLNDALAPDSIKKIAIAHINKHVSLQSQVITMQISAISQGITPEQIIGGQNAGNPNPGPGNAGGVVSGQPQGVGGPQEGNSAVPI